MIVEPQFSIEKQLEDALADACHALITQAGLRPTVLRSFGLDLTVCVSDGNQTVLRMIEVKSFQASHGRVGFGGSRGDGNQIRLLFDDLAGAPRSTDRLSELDPVIRWVLGDAMRPIGSPRYAFFTCVEAQAAAMNGVRPGKQNNLRPSAFANRWLTWAQLLDEVQAFLMTGGPNDLSSSDGGPAWGGARNSAPKSGFST